MGRPVERGTCERGRGSPLGSGRPSPLLPLHRRVRRRDRARGAALRLARDGTRARSGSRPGAGPSPGRSADRDRRPFSEGDPDADGRVPLRAAPGREDRGRPSRPRLPSDARPGRPRERPGLPQARDARPRPRSPRGAEDGRHALCHRAPDEPLRPDQGVRLHDRPRRALRDHRPQGRRLHERRGGVALDARPEGRRGAAGGDGGQREL